MSPFLTLILTTSIAALPASPAPEKPVSRRTLGAQVRALAAEAASEAASRSATRLQPGGDSLKNGAIIGAVMGGAAAAGFVGYLCSIFGTEDDNCFGGTLAWAGIGAAGGAAIGAGVDALFERQALAGPARTHRPRTARVVFRLRF